MHQVPISWAFGAEYNQHGNMTSSNKHQMRWSSKARPQHFVLCELGQLFLTKSREKRSTCSIALISSGKNSLRGKDFFVKVRTCATTISKIFIHSCGFRVFPRTTVIRKTYANARTGW